MSQQDDVVWIKDPSGGSVIILDHRHFPILVHIWSGSPTMEVAQSYFELRKAAFNRAIAEKTKCVIVADLSATGSPPATVRKYIGETAKTEDDREELLMYATCVPSAIMRGVVTALKWIMGDTSKKQILCASRDEALMKAFQELETAGISIPPFKYTPPAQ